MLRSQLGITRYQVRWKPVRLSLFGTPLHGERPHWPNYRAQASDAGGPGFDPRFSGSQILCGPNMLR